MELFRRANCLVARADPTQCQEPCNELFSYAALANALATLTAEPKNVHTEFQGSQAHGLGLLQSQPALDAILSWLNTHL